MAFQRDNLVTCLPGFEHINRYFDPLNNTNTAKILPGQYYVSKAGEMISTVLGSCVSACIRDPIAGIGGMNHFMLPLDKKSRPDLHGKVDLSVASRYGDFAMEKLINAILSRGGKRKNLEVKIFGGGRVVSQLHSSDIGKQNIDFVRQYLEFEGLPILAEDTGDIYPRKVHYFTDSGKVRVKKLQVVRNETITEREDNYYNRIIKAPDETDDLELFG
jgi:chemotaxis protein CheD